MSGADPTHIEASAASSSDPKVNQAEEVKEAAASGSSSSAATLAKDIENSMTLLIKKATSLDRVYRKQVDDRTEILDQEIVDKLKMLILNNCREIKELIVVLDGSPEFNMASFYHSENPAADEAEKNKWLLLSKDL